MLTATLSPLAQQSLASLDTSLCTLPIIVRPDGPQDPHPTHYTAPRTKERILGSGAGLAAWNLGRACEEDVGEDLVDTASPEPERWVALEQGADEGHLV